MHLRLTGALAALALAACGDYSAPSEVTNGVITASVQAPGANFAQYTGGPTGKGTFSVTPSVKVVDSTTGTDDNYTKDAPQIVNQIVQNMQNYGWTYVPFPAPLTPPANVDVVIALYAYKGSVAYGGSYCDWYYWGYYPYNCGYYYAGSYNFATLVMRMGDFKNAPPQAPGTPCTPSPGSGTTGCSSVQIVWGGVSYGLQGTQSYNLQRILQSIDTAFAQSPYLKK